MTDKPNYKKDVSYPTAIDSFPGNPQPQPDNTIDSEVEQILQHVWAQATLAAIDSMSDRRELAGTVVPKAKKKIAHKIAQEANKAQLEILRGFRRRDFVSGVFYETAVIDRIAQLTEKGKA